MKKSKADKAKIVARYMAKCEEFSKMSPEELVKLQDNKMSSTDMTALTDAINYKMREAIMTKGINEAKEPIINVEEEKIISENIIDVEAIEIDQKLLDNND
jgi:hypothetical protein